MPPWTPRLVQADQDVTADPGREVDLGLEVELDAHRERGVPEVALIVDGALEEVSCGRKKVCQWKKNGKGGGEGGGLYR